VQYFAIGDEDTILGFSLAGVRGRADLADHELGGRMHRGQPVIHRSDDVLGGVLRLAGIEKEEFLRAMEK